MTHRPEFCRSEIAEAMDAALSYPSRADIHDRFFRDADHLRESLRLFDALRRPRLLIQAARIGSQDYRRSVHLRRHLGSGPLPRPGCALPALMVLEATLDRQRHEDEIVYCVMRHVDVLIATMAEARLLRAAHT
mgnify:CR=1 FL=1